MEGVLKCCKLHNDDKRDNTVKEQTVTLGNGRMQQDMTKLNTFSF